MGDLRRHPVPSDVTTADWTLSVTGTVHEPQELTTTDLDSFPWTTATDSFHCVEGWSAEDLAWRGIPVDHILESAAPMARSAYGVVHAMDGDYACSFPLDRLEDSLLAVELDGAKLDPAHGGPARLVPPSDNRDCWESVKWVTTIELHEHAPTHADTARERALSRLE